ncbi:MAG: Methicillin resistance protein [Herbinix sp.]|nr:Methicillin resistance protein [Herbinix sp.]
MGDVLNEFTLNNTKEWDETVRSFAKYDIYYLSDYVKAFTLHGDGEPRLIYYHNNNIRAMNVIMVRDIAKDEHFHNMLQPDTYYDCVTPYGYGGFLIEGDIQEEAIQQLNYRYNEYCVGHGIISEFVRFHPIRRNGEILNKMYEIKSLGKTVAMKLHTKDQIFEDFTCKNRNMVRKAQKAGVKIYWGRSDTLMKAFIPLYHATMDRDKAKPYYYFKESFYDSLLNDLKDNMIFFYGVYQDKIIAMSIVLLANRQMHYHLSALDAEYKTFAPTNLLLYEAACFGCEQGYQSFHLGGGVGSKEDSLYQFKKSFNKGLDYDFMIGKKIFDHKRYDQLILLRNNELQENSGFFPGYRA